MTFLASGGVKGDGERICASMVKRQQSQLLVVALKLKSAKVYIACHKSSSESSNFSEAATLQSTVAQSNQHNWYYLV